MDLIKPRLLGPRTLKVNSFVLLITSDHDFYNMDSSIFFHYMLSLIYINAVYIYLFVVVNFDALAQASDFRNERRQLVFLCWEQDSNPGGLWNPIFGRLNACWQTDWAIEDQAKNLNSTARPNDQQAFSPPDPTAIWHSHLALALSYNALMIELSLYMFIHIRWI